MRAMTVRDIMTSPVVTVAPDTPFVDIVAALLDHDVSGVPVVDEQHRLVGIITEADLIRRQAYGPGRHRGLGVVADHLHGGDPRWVRRAACLTGAELMTRRPDVVGPDDRIVVAARRMLEHGHKRLVVVADDEVVGIVSRHDLLRPFARTDVEIATDVRRLLADPFRVAEDHAVSPSVAHGVVILDGTARRATDVEMIETEVAGIAGVVAVDSRLHAREHRSLTPPLRPW